MTILPALADMVVPIHTVKPKPGNARQHDLEDLKDSLRTFGQYRPIIANKATGHITKGNGTWKAAVALGWTEIAVSYVDVDAQTETRHTLVDNKTTELGWMNDSQLLTALSSLDDLTGTGYVTNDVEWLEKSLQPAAIGLPPSPAQSDDGDVPGGLRPGYADSEVRQLVLVVTGAKYATFLADLDAVAEQGENVALTVKRLILTAAGA